jgi:hypothetical protein
MASRRSGARLMTTRWAFDSHGPAACRLELPGSLPVTGHPDYGWVAAEYERLVEHYLAGAIS